MSNAAIQHYIEQLQLAMQGDIWVDETFDKKLAGIDGSNSFNRPLPDIHSVAEVISHLYEWRISILSNMRGGIRTVREESSHNWRTNEELLKEGWEVLLNKFKQSQQDLIDALNNQEDRFLQQPVKGESHRMKYYIDGLLQHDMYHLGQLGLIIKLLKKTV